jgi:hypothetical protein
MLDFKLWATPYFFIFFTALFLFSIAGYLFARKKKLSLRAEAFFLVLFSMLISLISFYFGDDFDFKTGLLVWPFRLFVSLALNAIFYYLFHLLPRRKK